MTPGHDPLPRGATIGILGGGQLARMLALAAARLGLNIHIFSPVAACPAANVSGQITVAEYEDAEAVLGFASQCDVVTYEFENVPAVTAKAAASRSVLRPAAQALDVAQDRLREKTFLREDVGVDVAPFADVANIHDLRRAVKRLHFPCVLKTRRFGYDGKGQVILRDMSELDAAYAQLGGDANTHGLILEGFVAFAREVSVVAARGADGEVAAYPLTENVHRNHILHSSTAPADHDDGAAAMMAKRILDRLGYVGVIGVEFFQMADGALIVNEIAPRVHNSGHWTQDAGCTDQFEQHIRAVAGWPLGDAMPTHPVIMTNLIGDDVADVANLAAEPGARLHLYGKQEVRPGRKMGHINRRL
jgi:5-(carboxyamino)imidazole ribonucleotide synthase